MLLNEITTSDEAKIAKINKALKETYGFSLVSEIETGKLNQLYVKIADDLYDLKLNQATAQDPAYMQKLLVLEGLKMIKDRKAQQIAETAIAGPGGRALDRVLGRLSQYVHKACEIGDEYEEAIKDAMKSYAIQPYRFDSDVVEYELRKLTMDCDPLQECAGGMMYEQKLDEVVEEDWCDNCDKWLDKCECDEPKISKRPEDLDEVAPVIAAAGRAMAQGAGAAMANKAMGGDEELDEEEIEEANPERYAERDWVRSIKKDKGIGDDDFELSVAEPDDDGGDDYFYYQANKSKRNEMKEGYVKELRRLLEAETDQAEAAQSCLPGQGSGVLFCSAHRIQCLAL